MEPDVYDDQGGWLCLEAHCLAADTILDSEIDDARLREKVRLGFVATGNRSG